MSIKINTVSHFKIGDDGLVAGTVLDMNGNDINNVKELTIGDGGATQLSIYDRDGDADSFIGIYYDKVDSDGLRIYAQKDGAYVTKPLYLYDSSAYQPAIYDSYPDEVIEEKFRKTISGQPFVLADD